MTFADDIGNARLNRRERDEAIGRMQKRMEDTRRRVGSAYPHWADPETGAWTTSETPLAPWKRVDDVQIFLSAKDRARVEREGGLISRDEYEKYTTDVGGRES